MARSAWLALLLAACAAPRPAYAPEDPLSGTRPPRSFAGFSALVPDGYAPAEGALSPPVAGYLSHATPFGEAAIVVERYGAELSREAFAARLAEGRTPAPTRHGARTAYHGLDFTVSERRIGPDDPWAESLGRRWPPPRLSLAEGRRFPPGGEAYRLYRCRKLGAWGVLGDYRRAQARGAVEAFRSSHPPEERRLVSACFGSWTAHAVAEGRPVPPLPKPSMLALRAMARREWESGIVQRRERECVVLVDAPDGFWALRLRAPAGAFAAEHARFEAFLAAFAPQGPT